MCINIKFCVLILYFTTLVNLCISLSSFFIESLLFSTGGLVHEIFALAGGRVWGVGVGVDLQPSGSSVVLVSMSPASG